MKDVMSGTNVKAVMNCVLEGANSPLGHLRDRASPFERNRAPSRTGMKRSSSVNFFKINLIKQNV